MNKTKHLLAKVLDLVFLGLFIDRETVEIDRRLCLAVIQDLPTAVLCLNDEAKVLDAHLVRICVLINHQLARRLRELLAVRLDLIVTFPTSTL